jgi:Asp-tRNA(Asn)/Glu-tRNA(Gln) amidotransferase A subunit family amidase
LGVNAKRRSLLGTFLLSTRDGMESDELELAQKIRHRMVEEYTRVMEWNGISSFITPVAVGKVPKISDLVGEEGNRIDPVQEYVNDYYTVYTNTVGACGVTIPYKLDPSQEFPASVRLLGYYGEDYHLLRVAKTIDDMLYDRDNTAKDWMEMDYDTIVDS